MYLIFDFDGTIADTLDTTVEIINSFLSKRNYKLVSVKELREAGGMKGLVESRHIPTYLTPYLIMWGRYNLAKSIKEAKVFPHLPKILSSLSKKHTLGIITSNSQGNVYTFLKNTNLENIFTFVVSETSLFNKAQKIHKCISKYKLEPQKTVYIGDETRDIEAANKAGIKSLAVSWGFESAKSLKKAKPTVIVNKPHELLKTIASL